MNKKIIAIAVASVMAAPVAMADVTVSGRVGFHLSVDSKENNAGVDNSKSARTFSDAGHGRLQIDAKEGSAYARIAIDARNWMGGATGAAGRDVYAGYKLSASSSLQAGRMGSAAKNLEKDPYIATFLQTRNSIAEATTAKQFGSSSFIGVMQYAAKFGGTALKVQYSPVDNSTTSTNAGHLGFSVAGKAGPANYWVSYNTGAANGSGTATDAGQVNAKAGASMKMGAAKITVNVTDTVAGSGSLANKSTSTAVWADFGIGNGMSVDVGYASNGDTGTWARAAINKKLNKGANIYAGVLNTTSKASVSASKFGVGYVVKF